MANVAPVTINDGKATPVAHVFNPVENRNGRLVHEDRTVSTSFIGAWKLTHQLVRPTGPAKAANRNLHLTVRVEAPTLETLGTSDSGLTPPPTIAYRLVGEASFTISERASKIERKDIRTLLANALIAAPAVAMVDDLESFW